MAAFSLPTLFILPASNTLPTTGTWADLTAKQFGVFKPDATPATAGNVAAQKYIILGQGRPVALPGVGSKRSDMIYLQNVVEWYKVTAHPTAANEIWEISDFSAVCGEDVTISIRVKSFYQDTAWFNGHTKSYTIKTPCCECGEDPCTEVDVEDLIDQFIALIKADTDINGLGNIIVPEKLVDGDSFKLRLTALPPGPEPTTADLTNFPYQYDRVYFWAFAYKGPAISQDYNVWNSCDPFATATKVQTASYPTGASNQILQMELDYQSYNTAPIAKQRFTNINFNQGLTTETVAGTYYDLYYLKYKSPMNNAWNTANLQDESVLICNPTGQNSSTITILTTFLGTPIDESGNLFTTSTTTSTTTA